MKNILTLTFILLITVLGNQLQAQKNTISGHVTDEKGIELPGVNIVYKGTTTGTTTDISGKFSLPFYVENPTLVISFIGYKTQEIAIGNTRFFEIVLEEEHQLLNELVVVGYGVQKRADLTGAVSPEFLTGTPN